MTDTKPMHSPLPWSLTNATADYRYTDGHDLAILAPDLTCAAIVWGMEAPGHYRDLGHANAALIVEAVNSHARLTAERAELVGALHDLVQTVGEIPDQRMVPTRTIAAYSLARALLSRLGG